MDFPPLSFPPLPDLPAEPWQWPAPPFAWRHRPAPEVDTAQPCRDESLSGSLVFGELLGLWAASAWHQMGQPENVRLVELGPGRGTMMLDA